jgi:ribonuclease Z
MQLSKYKIRRSRINHIFISHLHGDHYFGLPGLLTSYGLMNREQDLHLYAPEPLKIILEQIFAIADTVVPFKLHFHPLTSEGVLLDENKFVVECFKVFHRIECWGFIIREKKKPRKIDKERILQYDIPAVFYERLKSGEDYATKSGKVIKNDEVTVAASPPKSYAYCADTLYNECLAEKLKNITVLYHETTYLKELETRAISRFHSTTVQAADSAQRANAGRLLIGHFSSKYETLDEFLNETQAIFPRTELALEGVTYYVR